MVTPRPIREITKRNAGLARMFRKPEKAERAFLRALIHEELEKPKETNGRNISSCEYYGISRKHIIQLITNNYNNQTYTETIPFYISLICDFVNQTTGHTTCIVLDPSFYLAIQSKDFSLASKLLIQKKCNPAQFKEINHIFIIATQKFHDNTGHVFLIIISPKARTVEYLNSYPSNTFKTPHNHIQLIFQFLDFHFRGQDGREFDSKEWKIRVGKSPVQRTGSNDCGIWVCTVAMGVALGYGVLDGGKGWDVRGRRGRMAVELVGGGDVGGWGYEVLVGRGDDNDNDVVDGWRCVDGLWCGWLKGRGRWEESGRKVWCSESRSAN